MQIIKDRAVVEDDWQHVDGEPGEALPEGKIIVSLARWTAEKEGLIRRRNSGLGVRLEPGERAEDIADDIEHFQVIAAAARDPVVVGAKSDIAILVRASLVYLVGGGKMPWQ